MISDAHFVDVIVVAATRITGDEISVSQKQVPESRLQNTEGETHIPTGIVIEKLLLYAAGVCTQLNERKT